MNEHKLNDKELEITKSIVDFFNKEGINNINVYVDFSTPSRIEFKNDLVRLNYRIKLEESDCEEQLEIPTIFLDSSLRNCGIFKRLMLQLIEFCKKYNNMPILFTNVVSEEFARILIKHGGRVLCEDTLSGTYIAVVPKFWN